jgi:hypothetical protein
MPAGYDEPASEGIFLGRLPPDNQAITPHFPSVRYIHPARRLVQKAPITSRHCFFFCGGGYTSLSPWFLHMSGGYSCHFDAAPAWSTDGHKVMSITSNSWPEADPSASKRLGKGNANFAKYLVDGVFRRCDRYDLTGFPGDANVVFSVCDHASCNLYTAFCPICG